MYTSIILFMLSWGVLTGALPTGISDQMRIHRLNITDLGRMNWNLSSCHLRPSKKDVPQVVKNALVNSKLIEYNFIMKDYKHNPLTQNNTYNYMPNKWIRVASSHGQIILNLAFNYGVLSLMTLTFGIFKLDVDLEDDPPGCLGKVTEEEKVLEVLQLMLRDLNVTNPVVIHEGHSSVCHNIIKPYGKMANFTHRCCYQATDNQYIECVDDIPNRWLSILDILLAVLGLCVFVFGPSMIPDWLYSVTLDTEQYYVKLKEPLYKTLAVYKSGTVPDTDADHIIDLRQYKDFTECKRIVADLPEEKIIPIKISQFDIKVNYGKLLMENFVPVGVVDSFSRAVFLCKIRELAAFKDCCDANIVGCCEINGREIQWKNICQFVGKFLLVITIPIPFCIRLIVYYVFEHPEIVSRQQAAQNVDLMRNYEYRNLQFLTPSHPAYIAVYIIYFAAGFITALFSGLNQKTRFQESVTDAFADLKSLKYLKAVETLVKNSLWPFKRFGMFGICLGLVLWPFLLPISVIICSVYCLPIVFLSCRIILHMLRNRQTKREQFKPNPAFFSTDNIIGTISSGNIKRATKENMTVCNANIPRLCQNVAMSLMALATLYAIMILITEIIFFLAEIVCFTMMGIIVNASTVLKYGTLLFLVLLYSYDCYSNVNKKYLALNKAIFSEIKDRLGKDIEQYTQLPSYIQDNRGFKSAEASEQAEYESIDDISKDAKCHWEINDLILFIDKEDTPRIPKKLFDEVCQINVAGAPGPVYKSLLDATKKFCVIIFFLVFVFLVVLSFGENYKLSSTNQMLATMAGGSMPFMFRNVFRTGKVSIETGLLSFRSKLEEIIKNFCQTWPMYEFMFEVVEKEEDSSEDESEGGSGEGSCKKDLEKLTVNGKGRKKAGSESHSSGKRRATEWLTLIKRTKNAQLDDVKDKVERMKFRSASGKKVDIVILTDDFQPEWNFEDSLNELPGYNSLGSLQNI